MKNIHAMPSKHFFPLFISFLLFLVSFQSAQAQPYISVQDDYYEVFDTQPYEMQLFANDTIWTQDTIVWALLTNLNFGTVTPNESMVIPPALPPFLPTTPVWVLNEPDLGFTYTLEINLGTPVETFSYMVCDKLMLECDTATVTMMFLLNGVDPVPPQAIPDAAITYMDTSIEIDALVNDIDNNVPPSMLTLTELTQPEDGMVSIQNNKILYIPADDFAGTEQFSYTIENEFELTSTNWVSVVVAEGTANPIEAVDDSYSLEISNSNPYPSVSLFNIGNFILSNSGITENDSFNPTTTLSFCSEPELGTIEVGGTDDIPQSASFGEYIANTPGTEIICYELCDELLETCDQATITINISINPNDPIYPIAVDDFYNLPTPQAAVLNVTENDLSITNVALYVNIVENPSLGTAQVAASSNLITYTPNADFFMGEDSFVYQLCDATTGICSQATVIVSISDLPPPDDIFAIDDFVDYVYGSSLSIDVLANDIGENLDVVEVGSPIHGGVVLNLDNTITYSLETTNAPPEDYFNYIICGGPNPDEPICDTATVFISLFSMGNAPPVAETDIAYTEQGVPVAIDILANDDDPDGPNSGLTIQPFVSEYPEGIIGILPDNSLIFTPSEDFTGEFIFSYMICDSGVPEACDEAEVVIYVIDNNDGPLQAIDDFFTVDDNTSELQLTVLGNDISTESTDIAYLGQPQNGYIYWGFNPELPPFYSPDPNFVGIDSFFYVICDTEIDDCDAAMIYINVGGTAAIDAVDDYVTMAVNTGTTIQIFSNDIFNINTYTLSNVSEPAHGTISIAESLPEQISYVPNNDFQGQDQFTYTLCDVVTGECDMATVYVQVGSSLQAIDDHIAIEFYGAQNLDLKLNDLFANNAFITNFTQPENGTVGCDPAAIPCMAMYEPNIGFEGADSFDYIICDNFAGVCDTATVYLTVGVDCSMGCVWSGDANNDGVANNFDIMALGLGFGNTGTIRFNASNDWYPQPSTDWMQDISTFTTNDGGLTFDSITVNSKYADCNGNGIVEGTDIEAINQNYGLTHAKNAEKQAAADAPAISFSLPEQIPANTWITVDVLLGSEEQPAEDAYGLAFTIDYDSDIVELGSVSLDFEETSWFDGGDNISLYKDFGELGKIDVGYSRTDGESISGHGKIATFSIFVIDNVAGKKAGSIDIPFNISASNALIVSEKGFVQALNTEPAESVVTNIPTIDLSALNFYPNPSNDMVNFNFGGLDVQSLEVFNAMGQLMHSQSFEANTLGTTLEVVDWNTGMYFVRFQTPDGMGTRRLQVVK
ncbi:MAG: Ig-like domain-containing protein [Chitinophagales bacterium]